jgi:hypothetical protein
MVEESKEAMAKARGKVGEIWLVELSRNWMPFSASLLLEPENW